LGKFMHMVYGLIGKVRLKKHPLTLLQKSALFLLTYDENISIFI